MRSPLRHVLLWLFVASLLTLAVPTAPVATAARDVTVETTLSSEPVTLTTRARPEGTFTTFDTALPLDGEPGAPALPVVTGLLGIPNEAVPAPTVTLAEPQALPAFAHPLEPMPFLERDPAVTDTLAQVAPVERYAPDATLYAVDGWYPTEPVALGKPMTWRGQTVLPVRFTPVQVNLATGEARWFSEAHVALTWAAADVPGAAPAAEADPLLANALDNAEQARAWRQEVSPATMDAPLAGDRWVITLQGKGLFGIPLAQLADAGVDVSNPDRLAVFHAELTGTGERVETEQAIWIDGGVLYLVNRRDHGRWSQDVVYFLDVRDGPNRRMATLDGAPVQGPTVSTVPYKQRFEADKLYEPFDDVAGASNRWYWRKFAVPPGGQSSFEIGFALPHLDASSGGNATVTMELAPLTAICRQTRVLVNGELRGEKGGTCPGWDDRSAFDQAMAVPVTTLSATSNALRIEQRNLASGVDQVMLNSVSVTYPRALVADGQGLFFDSGRSSGATFQVRGQLSLFVPVILGASTGSSQASAAPPSATSAANARFFAFEVSDANAPQRITGGTTSGATFTFGRAAPGGERYLVARQEHVRAVASVQRYPDSGLRSDTSPADYLVITHPLFRDALQPLIALRQSQGYAVRVATTEQVYNEWGAGVPDQAAIRAFLKHAYQSWQMPPFVLLVGDATYDPFNILGTNQKVWLPPFLAEKDPNIGEVPADHGYVVALDPGDDPDTDPLPDMSVGRLPARSVADAQAMAAKIVGYESAAGGAWQGRVLLTTDDAPDPAGNFYAMSEESASRMQGVNKTKVYLRETDNADDEIEARNTIAQAINQGHAIIQYIGHGSRTQWSDNPGIWSTNRQGASNDLDLLQAGHPLPLSLPWTCWEGNFIYPNQSLSEQMIRLPERGVIGAFAPTGLDVATGHHVMTLEFYDTLFGASNPDRRIGLLTDTAKSALASSSSYERMMYTYMLFGDPATPLRIALP